MEGVKVGEGRWRSDKVEEGRWRREGGGGKVEEGRWRE